MTRLLDDGLDDTLGTDDPGQRPTRLRGENALGYRAVDVLPEHRKVEMLKRRSSWIKTAAVVIVMT